MRLYCAPVTVSDAAAKDVGGKTASTTAADDRIPNRLRFFICALLSFVASPSVRGALGVAGGSLNPMRPERRDRIDAVAGEESSITASFTLQWFER